MKSSIEVCRQYAVRPVTAIRHVAVAALIWMLGWGGSWAAASDGLSIPEFKNDVVPVLTKSGCNSAACHGAAIGRGGLRLSLLGYDPEHDYQQLVNQFKGRRVNVADPEKSLMLLKPTHQIRHGGGRRLAIDQPGYEIVRQWIAAGADMAARRNVVDLIVAPAEITLESLDEQFQISIAAKYDDGSTRDVTRWTVFEPSDRAAVRCDSGGKVTVLRRGQSSLMVRFLGFVDCVTVTVPLTDQPPATASRPASNYIDEHINRVLDRLRLDHSPKSNDATFVRRIYLDLIGTLPTPAETKKFLHDSSPDKRDELVERLMQRSEFVDHWSYKWSDLLRIESRRLGETGASAFHQWLRQQIADNRPLDEFANELLSARGDAHATGAANFHRVPMDARQQAEYVSQVFLGIRLQCANCHNHPLDRWSQDDYHGLAAVFARIDRGQVVKIDERGEVIHPTTGKAAKPRIPGEIFLDQSDNPRQKLAEWMTDETNPFFARNLVNRVWREMMGRGLVEPVDDHRPTNPPTHPALLAALHKDFIENQFNLRQLIQTIVQSEAYQRSGLASGNNHNDQTFYARSISRRLSPPVMVDAVSAVTGIAEQFAGLDATRAISLGDSQIRSLPLDLLGRCRRDSSCTPNQAASGDGLPLTLHIINGSWINDKLDDPHGRLRQMLNGNDDQTVIEQFYWLAYCRPPSPAERDYWVQQLASDGDTTKRATLFADFVWAILNSTEFRAIH